MGVAGFETPVHAGGGPENLLLVVNPLDEGSLRVANAYVAARHIPVNNIVYIAPPNFAGYSSFGVNTTDFTNLYQTPILNYIASHGLSQQIDYISTLGQPFGAPNTTGNLCLQDGLNQLTQLKNGLTTGQIIYRNSELLQDIELLNNQKFTYVPGTNTAIHHSQVLPSQSTVGPTTVQWYMSGTLGQWGENGISVSQTIQNLVRTVGGDGKKPQGTIYFEDTGDANRAGTRKPYWPAIQSWLSGRGIPWLQDEGTNANNDAPTGISNVRGCELGSAYYSATASTYLPGSWSDDLTSDGAAYGGTVQTKAVDALLAGNGGSSGTVAEPLADSTRFPLASIWAYQADGSTLGEAFYKSVLRPDLLLFHGDLLSQAYADVPTVTFTTAPANGSTVSGPVSITASASLNNPTYATGISHLELFADGLDTTTAAVGGTGTLAWDSTQATDGVHELRVVAYNNSSAASEGFGLINVVVNNSGESISISGPGSYNIAWNGSVPITVNATQGTGPAISSTQLQLLGLVLGTASGGGGTITLNASQLAYGPNAITPVANLANGKQVVGAPITITRQYHALAGRAVTPVINQNPGFDFYYYPGAAGNTLAATSFSGKPSNILHAANCSLTPGSTTPALVNMPNAFRTTTGGTNKGLAIQIKGSFNTTQAGEFAFYGSTLTGTSAYTSAAILIDGVTISSFDTWNGSTFVTTFGDGQQLDLAANIYLLPGEHTVTVQLLQTKGVADAAMIYSLNYRGLQEPTSVPAAPAFYTVMNKVGQ